MKIAIIGTGAYGSALANVLLKNNNQVSFYGIDEGEINDLKMGLNTKYFGQKKLFKLPYLVTNDLKQATQDCDFLILSTPSKFVESVVDKLIEIWPNKNLNILNISKGLNPSSEEIFSEFFQRKYQGQINSYASLIGPSFADEVFNGDFTIVNVSGKDLKFLEQVKTSFDQKNFKVFISPFQREIEYYSIFKNIYAIASGILSAVFKNYNALCSALVIAFQEINQFIISKYGQNPGMIEIASLGDFMLTCTSNKSRNFSFGFLVGQNGINKAVEINKKTVEGYDNIKIMVKVLKEQLNEYPFLKSIQEVLLQKKKPELILDFLD